MIKRLVGVVLLVFIATFSHLAMAQLQVSLPDTVVGTEEPSLLVPIRIEGLSGDSISGFTFKVGFDSEIISISGYSKSSTLSADFQVTGNGDTNESYIVSGAGSDPINSDGIILYLEISVNKEGSSILEFFDAEVNEGYPPFNITNGSVTIGNTVPLPEAPLLSYPVDQGINVRVTPTLKWGKADGAESYQVQLSEIESFGTLTIDNSTSQDSLEVVGLGFSTKYYWRARSINEAGSSNWSGVRSFTTTIQEPAVPDLTSPFNESDNVKLSPELTWSEAERAESYFVQVAGSDDFSSLLKEDTTSTISLQLGNLEYLTTYFWRVKAKNAGGESDWSSTASFTTIMEEPDMASLLFPENNATDLDTLVTMVWSEADRAESYIIQLSESSSFSNLIKDETVSDTVLSIGELDFSTIYYWRVKSINSGGESEWTVGNQFTTGDVEAGTPSLLSPSNNSTSLDTALTFTWTSAENATEYEVQVSNNVDFNTLYKQNVSVPDTSITFDGFDFETRYYWRVRAFAENTTSGWSSTFNFTTAERENEPPYIKNAIDPITFFEDFGVETIVNLDNVFGDYESEPLVYDIESVQEIVEVSISDSELIFSSAKNMFGSEEVIISARDEAGASVNSFVEVNITAINDLPYFEEMPDTLRFKSGEEYEFVFGDLVGDVEDGFSDLSFDYTLNPEEIDVQFSATDKSVTFTATDYTGEVLFTIKVTDLDGGTAEAKIVIVVDDIITSSELNKELPTEFTLSQNYPNPFNPTTQITYQLPEAAVVSFGVYDMTGREVYFFKNKQKSAGEHAVTFDASNLSSGIYIYQLKAGSFIETKKMTLIK